MYRKIAIVLILACLTAPTIFAQKAPEGIWEGYDGEWKHVSQQLVALAEATPPEKFAWRPAQGVRSTSEVYMHIAIANFWLLSVTGPKMPAELKEDSEKAITSKADVISWLKRSLDAVKTAHLAETFNVRVCPHFLMELHVALCCAVPNARWLEYIPQLDDITADRMRIHEGYAFPSASPGLGIDWNFEAIERSTVEGSLRLLGKSD